MVVVAAAAESRSVERYVSQLIYSELERAAEGGPVVALIGMEQPALER